MKVIINDDNKHAMLMDEGKVWASFFYDSYVEKNGKTCFYDKNKILTLITRDCEVARYKEEKNEPHTP